jgi:hypothetical protein
LTSQDEDELRKPLQFEEMVEFCRGRMAEYKIPSLLEVIDQFPMTTSGKIRKNVLRDRPTSSAAAETALMATGAGVNVEDSSLMLAKILATAKAVLKCGNEL